MSERATKAKKEGREGEDRRELMGLNEQADGAMGDGSMGVGDTRPSSFALPGLSDRPVLVG